MLFEPNLPRMAFQASPRLILPIAIGLSTAFREELDKTS